MSDYIRNRARLFVLIVAIRHEEPYAHRVVATSAERYQGIQYQPLIPFGNPMAPFDAPQWHVRAFRPIYVNVTYPHVANYILPLPYQWDDLNQVVPRVSELQHQPVEWTLAELRRMVLDLYTAREQQLQPILQLQRDLLQQLPHGSQQPGPSRR